MAKSHEKSYLIHNILQILAEAAGYLPRPFETPYEHIRRIRRVGRPCYTRAVRDLQRSGRLKIINKNNKKFIQLTNKGVLEALLIKAVRPKPKTWDGKWRVLIFDIPEDCHHKRDHLRGLLKRNNFHKLQASVFINPYPLNREALRYLRETGLIGYIRILRVDEMDDDMDLRKKFQLK